MAFEADHEPADAAREDFKHSAAARERKAFVAGATRIKKEPVADGEQAGLMAVAKNHDSSGRLQTPAFCPEAGCPTILPARIEGWAGPNLSWSSVTDLSASQPPPLAN